MSEFERILKTEYSENFDNLRKNRMVMSYYKYGLVKENYGNKLVNSIKTLEERLELYKQTGNTEYLLDVANQAMIEFMYPQHPKPYFEATDSDKSPGLAGMSINELKAFDDDWS
ncbi:MAG TPA: hypothetical protein VIO64_10780 [Pseudobacteroides sp.]|uniref:hypothetical protein n=1 Tax=Pseudobacteroides sp. TaxID=1968840 RepID=UPI002F95B109